MYLCRRLQWRRVRAAMDAADASARPGRPDRAGPCPRKRAGCSGSPADVLGRSGDRPVAAVAAATCAACSSRRAGRRRHDHCCRLGSARDAEEILISSGAWQWAAELGELRGEAHKTAATVKMVPSRALSFMNDPALARSVLPGAGERFDIEAFLRERGTVFMTPTLRR
jgi:hypothetical protein